MNVLSIVMLAAEGSLVRGEYHFYAAEAPKLKFRISNHDQPEVRPVLLPFVGVTNVTVNGNGSRFVFPPEGRVSSSTLDVTHFSNCRGRVLVENCWFQGMIEDALLAARSVSNLVWRANRIVRNDDHRSWKRAPISVVHCDAVDLEEELIGEKK